MAQRAPVLDPTLDEIIARYEREGPFPIGEELYHQICLDDLHIKWELHDGLLVEKPGMSFTHVDVITSLNYPLVRQIDIRQYRVLVNDGRLRRTARNYLVPDLSIMPNDLLRRLRREQPRGLGVFDEPLQLVVEVWSPSTGRYDVTTKIPTYKRRGDLEIWRLQPFERTLEAWRRREDGEYDVTLINGGTVRLRELPWVVVDLDALFDFQ